MVARVQPSGFPARLFNQVLVWHYGVAGLKSASVVYFSALRIKVDFLPQGIQ